MHLSCSARQQLTSLGASQRQPVSVSLLTQQSAAPWHSRAVVHKGGARSLVWGSSLCRHSTTTKAVRADADGGSSSTSGGNGTSSSSTSGSHPAEDEDPADIWAPVPPTPALGRKRKVAVLIAAAMLEITFTGALVWSPLLCAVALAVMQPTKQEIEQQQDEAVKQAVAAAEVQAYRHLPVTPIESAAWMNRLNQDMWSTFWQPFLLSNNLDSWQDTVSAAAPRGWEVEIADVSIGTLAPQMSGFQAFADPDTGAVTAVDADISFNSNSVRLVVVGRGPLGAFTAKVSAVQMDGHMRITPLLQHRMLLVAFKQPPAVRVSLSLSAPLFKTALSPGDLGQLNFIQGLIGSAIKDQLVEPRRMAISLDSDIKVEQAVSTTLHLTVDSITGLPRAVITQTESAAAGGGGSGGVGRSTAGSSTPSRVALVLVDTTTQVRRSSRAVAPHPLRRSAQLQQGLSLELRRKQGVFRLEVREVTQGPGGRVSVSRGQLLGSCLLWVAAARDGTTLFWAHDRAGAPLAMRWSPASNRPWQVTLPLTPQVPGAQALQVNVGVAVDPWAYKAGLMMLASGAGGGLLTGPQRSPGPRVVVVQVVEARGLKVAAARGSSSQQGPTTHVQLAYGQDTFRTSTQYGTTSPIFNEVFAFAEAPGILTHRIKLEVWQDDITLADVQAAAAAAASSGGSDSSSSSRHSGNGSSPSSSPSGNNPRRVLVPSSRRAGYKPGSRLRHSTAAGIKARSNSSSSSNGSYASGSSSSSSGVASHQLPDVEPDSQDPDSHMLVDLELQNEEQELPAYADSAAAAGLDSSSSNSAGNSGSSSSASLGSTFIELDQLSETLVQDRWYELSGVEGGEVRLRLAVVPGTLSPTAPAAGGGSSSSSSKRRQQQRQQQALTESVGDVAQMLSFFYKQLQRSSRDSIMVEVVSARLYLPLSSMDSSDVDQPAYVLSYGGRSTVTTPPYGRPARSRPASRTSTSSSSGGVMSRPSGGASRASNSSSSSHRASSVPPGSGSSSSSGGGGGAFDADSPTSSMFEEVLPGNISQQLVEGTCLARAVFPLHADSSQALSTAAAAAAGRDGASTAAEAAAATAGSNGSSQPGGLTGPPLKVLLFDPEDLSHATSVDAAAAIATAAALSRSRAATPGSSSAATPLPGASASATTTAGSTAASPVGGAGGPPSHPIMLSSSSSIGSSSSDISDIGGVEVNVQRLLAAARIGKATNAGSVAAAEAGVVDGGAVASAAAEACWEGWVKLDKDGGHLLLRITQLSASEPADIVPPTAISSSSSTAWGASASSGTATTTRGASQRMAAAAAAVAGPSGAAGVGSSSGGVPSSGSMEEEVEGLQDKVIAALKQGVTEAQGQLTDATAAAASWINSTSSWVSANTQSWLTPWRSSSSSGSGSGGGGGSSSNGASKPKQQQQQKPGKQQQSQITAPPPQDSNGQPSADVGAAAVDSSSSSSAGTAPTSGAAVLQVAEQSMRQQKQRQQQEPASNFALNLRFISRALGLAGPPSSVKQQQQSKQQPQTAGSKQDSSQEAAAGGGSGAAAADVKSHPLPQHALKASVASLDEPDTATQLGRLVAEAAAAQGLNANGSSGTGIGGGPGTQQGTNADSNEASKQPQQQQGSQPQRPPPVSDAAAAAVTVAAAGGAVGGIRSHPVPAADGDSDVVAGAQQGVQQQQGSGRNERRDEEQEEF